jgi:hypothetical protein
MPTRTQTSRRPTGGRFTRPAATPTRRRPSRPRRKPQKSGLEKAFEQVTAMLPGAGAKKGRRGGSARGRKPAGMAALAGAAGLAMKNRDKIMSLVRRRRSHEEPATSAPSDPATPPMGTNTPPAA